MHLGRSALLSIATLLTTCFAQTSIPTDLSSGFDTEAISLQVSFNGDAFNGFQDGATVSTSDASNTPVFALGDASGVNTAISFLVMMVDTTSTSGRTLHFLQTGFKAGGLKTGIASTNQPTVAYQKPGAFSETGARQYSFLLYQESSITPSITGLPQSGQSFDISKFQSANGLKQAEAGLAMQIQLGGSTSGGGQSSQGSSVVSQSSQASSVASQASTTSQAAGGQGSQQAGSTTKTSVIGSSSSAFVVTFQSPVIFSGSATPATSAANATSVTATALTTASGSPTGTVMSTAALGPTGNGTMLATTGSLTGSTIAIATASRSSTQSSSSAAGSSGAGALIVPRLATPLVALLLVFAWLQ